TLIALISVGARAQAYPQPRPTTAGDYDRTLEKASLASNTAFPFQFEVGTDYYENRNIATMDRLYSDRQAQGVERQQRTLTTVNDGKVLRSYSIMVGFGNNTYCSKDRVTWTGPQKSVCPGPDGSSVVRVYFPRKPESVEY